MKCFTVKFESGISNFLCKKFISMFIKLGASVYVFEERNTKMALTINQSEYFANQLKKALLNFVDHDKKISIDDNILVFLANLKKAGFEIKHEQPKKSIIVKIPQNKEENLMIIDEESDGIREYTQKYIDNELSESGTFEVLKYFKSFLKSEERFISVKIRIHDFAACKKIEREAKESE